MSCIIYFDLDGVLADFHKGFFDVTGSAPGDFSANEMWTHVSNTQYFFLNLEVTSGGKALFDFARNYGEVRFLTAIPRATTYPTAADEKVRWTTKYFGDVPVTAVQYARQKADYAPPHDILVDDSSENIRRWIKAGGQGIVHSSLDDTVAVMLDIVNRSQVTAV